jgi:hypothetical protein
MLRNLVANPAGGDHLRILDIDERLILQFIIKNRVMNVWTELMWHRIRTNMAPWAHSNQPPVPFNVIIEWLTLTFRIQQIPGSNLAPETGCYHWDFSSFSSVLLGECWDSTLKLASFHIVSNSSFTFIQRFIIWVTKKASLNKLHLIGSPRVWEVCNYLSHS